VTAASALPNPSPTTESTRSKRAPKLIVSDLDGTFLSPDGTVSRRNVAAVQAAQQSGIPVVFATGRPIRLLDPIRTLARATVVASNGAMTCRVAAAPVEDEVLSTTAISVELATRAFAELRSSIDRVAFAADSGTHCRYEPTYAAYEGASFSIDDDPRRSVGELDELLSGGDFVKLLVLGEGDDADALTHRVRTVLGDRLEATHSSPTRALVEVAAAGVSKAAALAALCDRLGVDRSEVAAFGDMPNDLQMLRWAGMPHVMGHAHPDLLALGATVIGSNAESAVGATIETWL
jgi:hypothetical protein